MKFKVTIEKLKKGWMFVLPVESERKGKEFIREVQLRDNVNGVSPKKLLKLKGVLKKNGSVRVVHLYRSKLKQGSELVKQLFINFRDQAEAGH